jgi:hypothetical protein
MSDLYAVVQTAEVALTAATTRTVLQLLAPANHRVRVLGWGVFFDGTSSSAEPVQVRVLRQTSGGTMTGLTPVPLRPVAETILTSTFGSATGEPSANDILDMVEVHPQQGYEVKFPMGQEIIIGTLGRLGIDCTAPAGVNVRAKFFFEE